MEDLLVAAGSIFEPMRFLMLSVGVIFGLVIGVIPGLGGLFGLAILIPLTYQLDPIAAVALLLGMSSVTTTSDTIPAVMIGVPGTVGAAATVVDGHELAKQGHAARALGAAYSASLIGGVFGALVLALALPVMRPLVLLINFGDLFAITVFGLTLVSILAGRDPIKGVMAALVGALVAYTGLDPHEGVERWTFGDVYLWDGVPTVIVFLGIFAVPELAGLLRRGQIQDRAAPPEPGGLRRGIRDTLRNWTLVLRSSAIGSLLGAVPGIGVTVIEWVAYGDASRKPGKDVAFGQGNIRGVIAPESANNAKEGGALIPTLAFGIPGSASMAILLGAFTIHGIVPGPDMLRDEAPLLISMILTIAIANLMGASICLVMTRPLARLATVPATTLVPIALVFVALGAFQISKDVRDFAVLLTFAGLGMAMKRYGWSRPAFTLGFVLAPNLERFFFLSYQLTGWNWLLQPLVIVFLSTSAFILTRKIFTWRRDRAAVEPPLGRGDFVLTLVMVATAGSCLSATWTLPFAAAVFPATVALVLLMMASPLLYRQVSSIRVQKIEKSLTFFWTTWFLIAVALLGVLILALGHIAGSIIFIFASAVRFGRPSAIFAGVAAIAVATVIFLVFDVLSGQSWPATWFEQAAGAWVSGDSVR